MRSIHIYIIVLTLAFCPFEKNGKDSVAFGYETFRNKNYKSTESKSENDDIYMNAPHSKSFSKSSGTEEVESLLQSLKSLLHPDKKRDADKILEEQVIGAVSLKIDLSMSMYLVGTHGCRQLVLRFGSIASMEKILFRRSNSSTT